MTRAVVLTGGIGSGKSAVAALLAGWGAHVVDADELAKEVVAPGSDGLNAVVAQFGSEVLTAGGALDRLALAEIVFNHAEGLTALEAIVHPRVEQLAAGRLADHGDSPVVVYEVPLPDRAPIFPSEVLAEAAPLVVVVDASEDVRMRRLVARGLSVSQIQARMDAQPTRKEWLSLADVVIDNDAEWEGTGPQVRQLWRRLTGAEPPVGGAG
jgi:dephospho-CoA kinase